MKFNKLLLSLVVFGIFTTATLVGCEDESATENQLNDNYISLQKMPQAVDVPEGETRTVQGKVYAAKAMNEDRVVNLRIIYDSDYNSAHPENVAPVVPVTTAMPEEVSIPASVTIPAGETEASFDIAITDLDLGYPGKNIVIGIVPAEGLDIAMYTIGSVSTEDYEVLDSRLVILAKRQCLQNSFRIQIVVDGYGQETTWELYDSNTNLIDSGGPYQNGNPGSGETRYYCLEDGDYTFIAYDEYGDGMYDNTNQGYYRLYTIDSEGNEVNIAQNGTFGDYDIVNFTLP